MTMVVFPNAKLNLGLQVLERRPDGYHNLASIFYPIPICDALEAVPADHWEVTYYGDPLDLHNGQDTVRHALTLLNKYHEVSPVKVCLLKRIPQAAGLAGGSSDGTFTLSLLNNLQELSIPHDRLTALSQAIGSDCAFFMQNKPSLVTGLGEAIQTIDLDLSGYYYGVVVPNIPISTKEAYQHIIPQKPAISINEAINRPINEWHQVLSNDFETYALEAYPALSELKNQLYQHGALYASMTGSGSAFYGIFAEETRLSERSWPDQYRIFEGPFKG